MTTSTGTTGYTAGDLGAAQLQFPPVVFGFELKKTPGFVPPAPVARLRDSVRLNLALGAHYLYTCQQTRQPSYHLVSQFLEYTAQGASPHRFSGESFGDDTEFSVANSSYFSKFVGVAFMSEYAGTTWYANLRGLWGRSIPSASSPILLRKRWPKKNGPDYLAADFAPDPQRQLDWLYALEFKGHGGKVQFTSPSFADWSTQAANISALDFNENKEKRLKSWVLCFNYAFDNDQSDREHSTLLVEDPWVGPPEAPMLAAQKGVRTFIIRHHLARQCRNLGLRGLGAHVLRGQVPEVRESLPPVYRVDHPQLRNRRYVGAWADWGPDGELMLGTLDSDPLHLMSSARLRILVDRGDAHIAVLRLVHPTRQKVGVDIFVDIRVLDPMRISQQDIDAWVVRLLRGSHPRLFIGQDAGMIRTSMRTPAGREVGGEEFTDPIEFVDTRQSDTPRSDTSYLQVIRNGGLITTVDRVTLEEDSGQWWR